jgi:arylsulfatase A-like enzyme
MPQALRLIGNPGLNLTKTGYCSIPVCGPARVGLLTGRYVHNHGVKGNNNPTSYKAYRSKNYDQQDVIARLRRAGYRTGFFGKFINGYGVMGDNGRFRHPYAFQWYALATNQFAKPYRVNNNGKFVTENRNHSIAFEERAEEFVRAVRTGAKSPWFCYLNFTDPHTPYTPPAPYRHAHDGARYRSPGTRDRNISDNPWAQRTRKHSARELQRRYEGEREELKLVDDRVRRIVTALQETGQMRNTLIFFSSDNGFMLGEHGGMSDKGHPYEESARVPFLVRGPGIPKSVPASTLVSHLDITYTILAAAGANRRGTDGRDLRKINSGRWRKRLLVEHPQMGWALLRERNKVLFNFDSDPEGDEFYDLANDPYQTHSLHNNSAYASQMANLASKLSRMRTAGGDKLRALEEA